MNTRSNSATLKANAAAAAQIKAAQAAALKAARAEKAAKAKAEQSTANLKATITDVPFVETMAPEAAAPTDDFRADMHKVLDDALDSGELPSWKRLLVAWLAGISTALGVGHLASIAITYALVGVATLTASVFVSYLVMAVGILIAMYLGFKTSGFAYGVIASAAVDRCAINAYHSVRGWFGSAPAAPVAS